MRQERPNVVYVLADQWRAQDTGYAGNKQVRTPHLDSLAAQSINFTHAVAGIPVCCPARASLLTGQHALTHGVFLNDVHLADDAVSMAKLYKAAGYDTAYVGKWHVDGRGRSNYIPPESRQGFDYWKALECTHDYNNSKYYAGDSDAPLNWEGYDAIEQTKDVQAYLRGRNQGAGDRDSDTPFLLVLSWGPPHAPYETAPADYQALYSPEDIELRPNVTPEMAGEAREWIAGYYAHCTALDDCLGGLLQTLEEGGLAENTIFVFTSDHGDMLGSQGEVKKQRPWEESIRVPFLLRWPRRFGLQGREIEALLDTPDILPTLLSLCEIPIPETVEGKDFADAIEGGQDPSGGAALIYCPHPFGQFLRPDGGREYRGLRTRTHTYARDLNGPWLLYDNEADPFQLDNLVDRPEVATLQAELESQLQLKLDERGDKFLPGETYVEHWGYTLDETGTVPFNW
ncbi:MAG: sulfatase [Caldilineaceae bacterium]|nr:sulfatase [Caldilineaceae bacterium]MDE0338941.1 sulfatase [Caldilineaceae bacterium]